jgi:hypothetical protein
MRLRGMVLKQNTNFNFTYILDNFISVTLNCKPTALQLSDGWRVVKGILHTSCTVSFPCSLNVTYITPGLPNICGPSAVSGQPLEKQWTTYVCARVCIYVCMYVCTIQRMSLCDCVYRSVCVPVPYCTCAIAKSGLRSGIFCSSISSTSFW